MNDLERRKVEALESIAKSLKRPSIITVENV